MTDLETVLPSGVQVLSIEPEVSPDGAVAIRLRVNGARDRAVELVRNLEKSRHFAYPRLAGEALATSTGPNQGVQPINASMQENFDILADYRPLSRDEEKSEHPGAAKTDTAAGEKRVEEKSDEQSIKEKKPRKMPAPAYVPGAPTQTGPGRRGAQ